MTGASTKERRDWHTETQRHTHTQGRRLCDNGGRDWRDVANNQGNPRIAGSLQKLGRGKKGFFPRALRRSTTLLTPDFRLASGTLRE